MPAYRVRSQKIDRAFGDRCTEAIRQLGDFTTVATNARMTPSQLSDMSRHVIEPSKALIRYLGSAGFSVDWLLFGRGPRYFAAKGMDAEAARSLAGALKRDLDGIKAAFETAERQAGLLIELFSSIGGQGKPTPRRRRRSRPVAG